MYRHTHAHTNTHMSKYMVSDPGIHVTTYTHTCMYAHICTDKSTRAKRCVHTNTLTYRPASGDAAGGLGGPATSERAESLAESPSLPSPEQVRKGQNPI